MASGKARKLLELALQGLDGKENLQVIAARVVPRDAAARADPMKPALTGRSTGPLFSAVVVSPGGTTEIQKKIIARSLGACGLPGVRWCWCQRLGAGRRFQHGF
jgi:hypothetical protein